MWFILPIIALIVAFVVFPMALRFAVKHRIMDMPDARKLQNKPVPVFGGIVVVVGMLVSLVCASVWWDVDSLWYPMMAILLLWAIGVTDDIRGLSAVLRFILELGIVWLLVWKPNSADNGFMINNLYGLLDRHEISAFTSIPLTLIAGVGIINSINLIDGVDGYASGFGIVANILFAGIFYWSGDMDMAIFASVTAAALIPFYLHNILGQSSKMYIGDGGSLVIGFVMAYNVFAILDGRSACGVLEKEGIGLVPLCVAALCIPIFDTVRVMIARLAVGRSPFLPDKTHLHHLLIDMGCSHAGTSTTIIVVQILIVLGWLGSYCLGLSITGQFICVMVLGILVCGAYYALRYCQRKNNKVWQQCCRYGKWTHFEKLFTWISMQKIIDSIG